LAADKDQAITVVGARVHNLQNITARIPLNSLTVVTGVSGSGKSSLAYDTLYAEGQRRYVASLSAYARQFLERISRPDLDDIIGICPALAIRQKSHARNPRSTVGTVTEINDYLRLLYARIGVTYCRACGRIVQRDTPEKIGDFVMSLPEGMRLYLCLRLQLEAEQSAGQAGVMRKSRSARAGTAKSRRPRDPQERFALSLPGLLKQGFQRLLIGSQVVGLEEASEVFRSNAHKEVHILVDRLTVQPDLRGRLVDSLEVCGRESGGQIEVILLSDDPNVTERLLDTQFPHIRWTRHPAGTLVKFSERFECQLCQIAYQEPEPRLFSFNNPFGACPECQGFGNTIALDMDRIIPDKSKTLSEGAVHPWTRPRYKGIHGRMLAFAEREGIPTDASWAELTERHKDLIIHGKAHFPGIMGFFAYLERKKYKMHIRVFISRYRGYATCLSCHGERLRPEARDVLVSGKRITEISRMTIQHASEFFNSLELTVEQKAISGKILEEICNRLRLLVQVGLEYLTLDRLSSTLSGGESQRIQLATSLGSTLIGTLYVLDEPSIGLHPRDGKRLIGILRNLRDLGNTVLVVEHDAEIMRSADHIIDLGPRAGENGGQIVFEGSYAALTSDPTSLTARYLRGDLKIPTPIFRRKGNGRFLEISNARKHNLKGLNLRIPLGMFVCITGVSGSGKSTLAHDVLFPAVKHCQGKFKGQAGSYNSIRGVEFVTDLILADQTPIGKTPRSNPATYTKAFDDIRQIYAKTRDAYSRNLGPGSFSFNLPGGRCETCKGNGTITVEMQFLADVELPCEECKGNRFKSSVLEMRYKGKNIAEALDLTIREAIAFFAGHPRLVRKLRILDEIGLGYLRLGQSATSFSGGEAQRIKLGTFISRNKTKNALFIFDEPTTGLHFDDIRKLLLAFDKLIDSGNSVLVIEHNLDVIKSADWVVDLGPEGGDAGGEVIFEGSPDDLINCESSYTGQFLKKHLDS
jgi:excinuclease ABC subunit A